MSTESIALSRTGPVIIPLDDLSYPTRCELIVDIHQISPTATQCTYSTVPSIPGHPEHDVGPAPNGALDFNFSRLPNQLGEAIKITVNIHDPNNWFMPDGPHPQTGQMVNKAITAANLHALKILHRPVLAPPQNGQHRSCSFTCRRLLGETSVAAYNLGLIALNQNGSTIDWFYDPKIKNDG